MGAQQRSPFREMTHKVWLGVLCNYCVCMYRAVVCQLRQGARATLHRVGAWPVAGSLSGRGRPQSPAWEALRLPAPTLAPALALALAPALTWEANDCLTGGDAPALQAARAPDVAAVVVPILFLVLLSLGVSFAVLYAKHRRLQGSFIAFANSHYSSRLGAAVFSSGDDLGTWPFLPGRADPAGRGVLVRKHLPEPISQL